MEFPVSDSSGSSLWPESHLAADSPPRRDQPVMPSQLRLLSSLPRYQFEEMLHAGLLVPRQMPPAAIRALVSAKLPIRPRLLCRNMRSILGHVFLYLARLASFHSDSPEHYLRLLPSARALRQAIMNFYGRAAAARLVPIYLVREAVHVEVPIVLLTVFRIGYLPCRVVVRSAISPSV